MTPTSKPRGTHTHKGTKDGNTGPWEKKTRGQGEHNQGKEQQEGKTPPPTGEAKEPGRNRGGTDGCRANT